MVSPPPRGYDWAMRFRLGLATGFAAGYYLGAKAGRERYEQINHTLAKVRRSEAYETATDKAKAAVDAGVEKARDVVGSRFGDHDGDDTGGNGAVVGPPPLPSPGRP